MTRTPFECTRDNLTLRGYCFTDDQPGKKTPIIFCHGYMGSMLNQNTAYAEAFAALGYAAYIFDFAGGGFESKSDGEIKDMTIRTECEDLKAVIRYVQAQPDRKKEELTIVGNSFGGLVGGLVAAELQDEVKCLVMQYPGFLIPDICWGGHLMYFDFDPYDIKDTYEGEGHVFGGQFIREGQLLDSYDIIPQYRGRTLILQGTADPVVPMTDSIRAWRAFCRIRNEQETTKLVLIEGAGHGFEGKDFDRSVEEIHRFIQKIH